MLKFGWQFSSPVPPSAFQQAKRLRPPTGTANASAGPPQRCLLYQQLAVEWNIGKHTAGPLQSFFFFRRPPSTAHHFPLLRSVCLPGSETDGSGSPPPLHPLLPVKKPPHTLPSSRFAMRSGAETWHISRATAGFRGAFCMQA